MTEIRKKTIEGLKTGDKFVISRKFTEQDVMEFADLSKDYNPVHFDDRFVSVKGYNGKVCHGLLIGSMVTEIGGQIGWLASELNFKFIQPVYFEDTITCDFTLVNVKQNGRAEAKIIFRNQHNVIVLEATLKGIIPGDREKVVMKTMISEGDPTNKIQKY